MYDRDLLSGTPDEVQGLLDLTGLPEGAEVLDLCCGFGRHSLEMARRGLRVTGIDRTQSYIERAKREGADENLNCSFKLGDVRHMTTEKKYDGVASMWNSFGYTEDPEDDHLILEKVSQSLKPGGVFILDTPGKEVIASGFEANTWFERGETKILLEYSIEMNWTVLRNRWLFFENEKMWEFQFTQRIYSALELSQMLYQHGFDDIDIWGSWDGAPYDDKAERLILVAKKVD